MSQMPTDSAEHEKREPVCVSSGNYLWPDPPSEDKYSACVHCGMCLEACPTYDELGQEHQSPRGRVYLIKAVAEGKMDVNEAFADPIFTCLDCRACETACPSGVQVGTLIEEARGQVRQAMPLTGWKKAVNDLFLKKVFPYPARLHTLGSLFAFYQKSGLQKLVRKTGLLHLLPSYLRDMEAVMPSVAKPIMKTHPRIIPAEGPVRKRVAFFTGCVMDAIFGEVNEATIRVLTKNGYEVVIPEDQRCCGALHVHAGEREEGKKLARRNIDAFLAFDIDRIVVNAAGCGCALKEYPELLHHDERYREKAETFAGKVEDVAKFLYDNGYRKPRAKLNVSVTYHDACHLAHGQGIRLEPRQILKNIPGVTMVEFPDADRCCGSAGIYNLTHPEMAGRILDKKMENVPREVELISMGNPGCMLQVAIGIQKHGRNQKAVHTIQLLDWAYQEEQRQTAKEG
ncbi:heterodisulfide reductase-related iron-sulfur binding cluster [Aneurinibacillus thermoaerophilus]|uniref:heterodisulfide reductase-related iron-sulfur binding cluster n=1 Tax=Aneurinibacillus thermoaerophilus TaxID=143495 RepID=UPI00399CCE59